MTFAGCLRFCFSELVAVGVTTQPGFSPGTPAPLFEKSTLRFYDPQYDVAADGKRFILRERLVEQPWQSMSSTTGSRNFVADHKSKHNDHSNLCWR
jgi:hypothetical protein